MWQVWDIRDILRSGNVVLRDRCRTSVVSSAWQAWHFLHDAKMLAGVGRNQRCLVNLDVLKGSKVWLCA